MAELVVKIDPETIVEKILDEYCYNGKTLREWADLITKGEVRPVKRGNWEEGQFKYLTCSECGCVTNLYDQYGFPIGQDENHCKPCFCPHCGADMRPEEREVGNVG